MDLMVMVEQNGNDLTFKSVKERDVEKFSFSARAHWKPGRFWLSPTDHTERKEQKLSFGKGERHVLRFLAKHGPAETSDIIKNPEGCAKSTARSAIYALAKAGYVDRLDDGCQGVEATYTLTDEGKQVVEELGLL